MDSTSKIETFKASLRLKFASDLPGLRKLVHELTEGLLTTDDEVMITSHGFVDGSAAGQAEFSRLEKLNAALSVLAELDADTAAVLASPGRVSFAEFSRMCLET
jgi:hypothetical protein